MSTTSGKAGVRNLFGVPVHALTMDQAMQKVEEAIAQNEQLQIGVVNAAKIVNMHRDETLRQDVVSSDLILADGMSVVWASHLLGQPLPERVTGIDLMLRMLRHGNKFRYRIYCLGATDDVLEKVTRKIAEDYPNVNIVGKRNGYFTAEEEADVAADIKASRPDILLVAITSPKKEQFLARWSDELAVPICHGVGGSFDVLAGKVDRAPEVWQRLGLEWLYRVKQEPGRLWKRYLVTNLLFCGMVARGMLRRLTGGAKRTSAGEEATRAVNEASRPSL
jgi:N-acetylglucosaminyldiphosphoundecaprenol N-acetyl-beta-D-mannosaminyltransferase